MHTSSPALKLSWRVLFIILAIFTAVIIWIPFAPTSILYSSEIAGIEEAIKGIERYKFENGHYPLESQYRPASEHWFYVSGKDCFVIGFNSGFDEHYEYDSKIAKWSFEKDIPQDSCVK